MLFSAYTVIVCLEGIRSHLITFFLMELQTTQSFDSDNDQTSQQAQSDVEGTLRSDHDSRNDFEKNGIFVERTLALIKPDAINSANDIEAIIFNHGFTILQVCY